MLSITAITSRTASSARTCCEGFSSWWDPPTLSWSSVRWDSCVRLFRWRTISIIGEKALCQQFAHSNLCSFRYIVKGNLFAPVVEAFIRNNGRYNLLESAILELFEFIKLEDIKILCTYVVENFGKIFDEIQYVQTFKNLRNKYDQHQDRIKDKEKGYDS